MCVGYASVCWLYVGYVLATCWLCRLIVGDVYVMCWLVVLLVVIDLLCVCCVLRMCWL